MDSGCEPVVRQAIPQPLAMGVLGPEKVPDSRELRIAVFQHVHCPSECLAAGQRPYVPAYVLARGAHAQIGAIKPIVGKQVFFHQCRDLVHQRRRKMGSSSQEMIDFAEDPGPALRGAADHHRIGPGRLQHRPRLFRRGDVAVGHDRDA
jgi:hypothetical protein